MVFLCGLFLFLSVLLTNTKELIEMQTRNDSTDPRSGSSYYNAYHSLEDVHYTNFNHQSK